MSDRWSLTSVTLIKIRNVCCRRATASFIVRGHRNQFMEVEMIKGKLNRIKRIITRNSTVRLIDISKGTFETYSLVDPSEAQPEKGQISVAEPLGRALLGSKEGDVIQYEAPGGVRQYFVQIVAFFWETRRRRGMLRELYG